MTFPLEITNIAVEKMIEARTLDPDMPDDSHIRISLKGGGCAGFKHNMEFDTDIEEDDLVKEYTSKEYSINVLIDDISAVYLAGVTLDYIISEKEEGFKFSGGSNSKKTCACGQSVSY